MSDSVTAVKLFEWRRGGATLTHDGYNVIVLNQDLTSALSTSILTTSETTGGTVNYTCTATAVGSTGVDYSSVMVTGMNIHDVDVLGYDALSACCCIQVPYLLLHQLDFGWPVSLTLQ